MKIVIIGGVAGGASAATRARRLAEDAEIVLIERGANVSFANCGLPYYLGGVIEKREKLLVASAKLLRARFRIDVRTSSLAESIDRAKQTVRIRELATGRVYEEPYDQLILAPGAVPLRPEVPGSDSPRLLTLRNLDDMDQIESLLAAGIREAVIVGGGFIGIELAENLVHRGIHATLIQRGPQLLSPMDPEMTQPLLEHMRECGVTVYLNETLRSLDTTSDGVVVWLESGRAILAGVVLCGIGVAPESTLADHAGLEMGLRRAVEVNEQQQTSDPHIFAVGDVTEVSDFVLQDFGESPSYVPLAGPANRQGRLAADAICGREMHLNEPGVRYRGTQGTLIVGCFGCTAASTGASEKSLKRRGINYRKVYIHPADHAGYYPNAQPMTLKLLFDPQSGRVLGAQGVGGTGVDKRIDVLSMAIQAKMTVFDLEESELCYAPQYGSAKDPINMLGFVASGLLRGYHPQIDVESLPTPEQIASDASVPMILDVRTPLEFAAGAIPGAVLIPVDELRDRLGELPRNRPIAVYCKVGMRGYIALRILLQHGFDAVNIGGGWTTWRMHQK